MLNLATIVCSLNAINAKYTYYARFDKRDPLRVVDSELVVEPTNADPDEGPESWIRFAFDGKDVLTAIEIVDEP